MRRLTPIALIATLAIAGCGSGSGDDGSADTASAPPASTQAAPTPATTSGDARTERRLRDYLRRNFGGTSGPATSWYRDITVIQVVGGDARIATDVSPDADFDRVAQSICTAVAGADISGLDGRRVAASDGTVYHC